MYVRSGGEHAAREWVPPPQLHTLGRRLRGPLVRLNALAAAGESEYEQGKSSMSEHQLFTKATSNINNHWAAVWRKRANPSPSPFSFRLPHPADESCDTPTFRGCNQDRVLLRTPVQSLNPPAPSFAGSPTSTSSVVLLTYSLIRQSACAQFVREGETNAFLPLSPPRPAIMATPQPIDFMQIRTAWPTTLPPSRDTSTHNLCQIR